MEYYEHSVEPIDALIPYANNAREHSDEQIAELAGIIREFGFTNPLLIDENKNIIAGHGRLTAARMLGFNELPVITVTNLSEEKRKALVIADNKLALNSTWNEDMLILELKAMGDNATMVGFSEEELKRLLVGAEESEFPELADGEKSDFEQMSFILHESQAETVKLALAQAKQFEQDETHNENSNGNALYYLCAAFLQ